ncbi:MAG: trypsin-like peptidase domain-containing protein [Actinobacteria bacterium]|nr:trypsin-like peptidase domain-containing protein [Actinomycetota bacterium]
MARSSSILSRAVGLVAAAVAGGALALGGAVALGELDATTTTTVREVAGPVSQTEAVGAQSSGRSTVNGIYERTKSGVVQVNSTSVVQDDNPFFDTSREAQSLGSGFVMDKAGHIVTNFHVVQGATKVRVSFSNSGSYDAEVVGSDPATDIAVLRIDAGARALTPLPLGDSDRVRVGDPVVAIGNPFGLERSVTAGIVSALQRQITAPDQFESSIDHVIQTDAAINRGNSGGPLLNMSGEVIGVNSQISTGDTGASGNVGIGFAVPTNTVKDVVAQLVETGKVERAYLGVGVQPITSRLARLLRLPAERGLIVQKVSDGSGAKRAGLRAGTTRTVVEGESYLLGGDVIVEVDGDEVTSVQQLRDAVAEKEPGDELTLTILRGDDRKELDVTLGQRPSVPEG